MSDLWDEEDRAIARALDVPDDGGGGVDRRALEDYREVLGHLPLEAVAPPEHLEDHVMAAALARRRATTSALDPARARQRSSARAAALAAIAVAAAIVVAVLAMRHDSSSPLPRGRITAVAASRLDVAALLRQPGARTGTFDHDRGKVVLGRNGKGDVYALDASAVVGIALETRRGTATALGSAVPTDGALAFWVDNPDLVTAVRLTTPDGTLVARATLSAG